MDDQAQKFAATLADPLEQSLGKAVSVDDSIKLSDAAIRKSISAMIMWLFGIVNIFMLGLIVWLARVDQSELTVGLIHAPDRLIGRQVLIALLGATTVQLGTIAVIMAKFVFKAPVDGG